MKKIAIKFVYCTVNMQTFIQSEYVYSAAPVVVVDTPALLPSFSKAVLLNLHNLKMCGF